ncbi:MAG: IS30 family transposase [Candidatus Nanopelagicales bacterium]
MPCDTSTRIPPLVEPHLRLPGFGAAGSGLAMCVRQIAVRLGRSPSTISRELARNRGDRCGYQPLRAQQRADRLGRRPKQRRLHADGQLRNLVQAMLRQKLSPQQISCRLGVLFSDDVLMQVSAETIYQAIYVQGRGSLRRELAGCLRTGRAVRRPRRRGQERRGRIPDMVMISERPAEAEDRAVPGHWEGDLIIGKNAKSAIGTGGVRFSV